ncbi:hypothetical protein GCM10027053_10480 [Intrasporangium mesophilum]
MYDLNHTYPEMYLATAQDRIRNAELSRKRAQWRAERRQSGTGRRRVARLVARETPSTQG